jgi:benzoyl-CoA reductase/2-hydroxyglutaryl-CoA dehydratase subunit BcrC/BadD/HgdB
VPEEVIDAAGILPIRLTGDSEEPSLEEASAYMYINTCSFVRGCLDLVLKERYRFLDGFVSGSTCDCPRRLTDVWQHYGFTPFVHIMDVPRKMTRAAHDLYREEVQALKKRIEESFGLEISDGALRRSIETYNHTRRLLKKLYELRKSDRPPITGAEVLEVLDAGFKMPREQFNRVLERLVDEAGSGQRKVPGRFRLMVSGSPLNNPEFIRGIEELGGLVVVDELCTGVRHWWDLVDEGPSTDPVEALSRRYLDNFPCPRMYPPEERLSRAVQLVREYRVDGVISEVVRYCVHCAHDQPLLKREMEREGVPVLELSLEYGASGTGQIRTRVQAFLEMLEARSGR